jgi:hypothetical protein
MMNALPEDVDVPPDDQEQLLVRRPSLALARAVPDPLMPVGAQASIWKRLDSVRMSEVERSAAVDALILGRDIGLALQYLGRMLRRWVGSDTAGRSTRHASFRHLVRLRRARASHRRLK